MSKDSTQKINIFTDGSCYYKTKQGGLGVYIIHPNGEHFISEGYAPTTISRMEGFALLRALQFIDNDYNGVINIYSDSEYIIKTFTDSRRDKWELYNFMGVKNLDMWQAIFREYDKKSANILFYHIRGHNTNLADDLVFGNNVADILCNYKNFKNFNNDNILCKQE